MKITKEFIHQHRTDRGGFTAAQIMSLGESYPTTHGWIERACQRELTQQQVADFVRYSDKSLSGEFRKGKREEWRAARKQVMQASKNETAAYDEQKRHITQLQDRLAELRGLLLRAVDLIEGDDGLVKEINNALNPF